MTSWSGVTGVRAEDFWPDQSMTDDDIVPCMARSDIISFKDKLVGKNSGDFVEEHDNWCSEDEEEDLEEDDDSECPSISLSKEEKARIRKLWR